VPSASVHVTAPATGPVPFAAARAVEEAAVPVQPAPPPMLEPSARQDPIASSREPTPALVTRAGPASVPAQPLRPRAPASPTPVAAPEPAPLPIAPPSAGPLQAPSPPLAASAVSDAHAPVAAHLAEDLALLRQAHQVLRAGDPATALSLLDGPGSPLDAGPLAEEAQLVRISALCQLGRATAAHAAIERLLAAWPGSPAGMRLRSGCAVLATPRKGGED